MPSVIRILHGCVVSWAALIGVSIVVCLGFAARAGADISFVSGLGSLGSGAGQLISPEGVATARSGDVYVADYDNSRIVEFSSAGAFVRTWGWGVADGAAKFEVCSSSCQAATVRFTIEQQLPGRKTRKGKHARCVAPTTRNRTAPRCIRMILLRGSFSISGGSGTNAFRLTGRLAGKTLPTGAYTLTATPTVAGLTGNPASVVFRVF